MNSANPRITSLLYRISLIECVVLLIAGMGLFFLPSVFRPLWPWELTPFNTRLLGGAYMASLASTVILVWIGHWSPARVILPMIFIFTIIVLIVSLINLDRFTQNDLGTVAWFALYIIIPVNAAYHLWLYRNLPPVPGIQPSVLLHYLLWFQIITLGLYGVGLLVAPGTFSRFWPWLLDDFHARMYSVAFITPAVGAWMVVRGATGDEFKALGVTQILGGLLPIIGMIIVDQEVNRIQWNDAGTWVWIILFAFMAGAGGIMLNYSRRDKFT